MAWRRRTRSKTRRGPMKRKRSMSRRKAWRRRTRGRKAYTKISRMPMPDRYLTKLKYSDRVSSSITVPYTGPVAFYYQTSLYDPQTTAGGHKPLWTNQIAALYGKYRVYGMKYRWTINNAASYNSIEGAIVHQDAAAALTDMETAKEQTGSRSFTVGPVSAGVTIRSGYLSVPKVFGLSRQQFMGDDGFVGQSGASLGSPAKMAQCVLYMRAMGPGDITANVNIDITYYVEFMNRLTVGGS